MLPSTLESADLKGQVLAILFGRVLSATQATILLLRAGLPVEAEATFRSAMEAMFRLAAITADTTLLHEYLGEDYALRQSAMQMLRKLQGIGAPCHDGITVEMIDWVLRKNQRDRQAHLKRAGMKRFKTLHIEAWAAAGGQLDVYYAKYALLSGSVHHSSRSLERAISKAPGDSRGHVIDLRPSADDPTLAIADAMVVLARACRAFAQSTEREVPDVVVDGYKWVESTHAKAAGALNFAELD